MVSKKRARLNGAPFLLDYPFSHESSRCGIALASIARLIAHVARKRSVVAALAPVVVAVLVVVVGVPALARLARREAGNRQRPACRRHSAGAARGDQTRVLGCLF